MIAVDAHFTCRIQDEKDSFPTVFTVRKSRNQDGSGARNRRVPQQRFLRSPLCGFLLQRFLADRLQVFSNSLWPSFRPCHDLSAALNKSAITLFQQRISSRNPRVFPVIGGIHYDLDFTMTSRFGTVFTTVNRHTLNNSITTLQPWILRLSRLILEVATSSAQCTTLMLLTWRWLNVLSFGFFGRNWLESVKDVNLDKIFIFCCLNCFLNV
jgi:hypothetical protein